MWTGSRNAKDMKYAQPAKRAYHVSSSDIKEECAHAHPAPPSGMK
jgi:hypothetical protein